MLAEPITRLVYQRGEFDAESTDLVSTALFWFSFSLPFSGVNLLLTRTFFSLQRPWLVTRLSVGNLLINVVASVALLPLGIGGIVAGTAIADLAMAVAQAVVLRRELGGQLGMARTVHAVTRMLVAAAVFGVVAYGAWAALDAALGTGFVGQLVSVGGGLALGTAAYAAAVVRLGIPEARQLRSMFAGRLGR